MNEDYKRWLSNLDTTDYKWQADTVYEDGTRWELLVMNREAGYRQYFGRIVKYRGVNIPEGWYYGVNHVSGPYKTAQEAAKLLLAELQK